MGRFFHLSLCQAAAEALRCGVCYGKLVDGEPGFSKSWRQGLVKDLSDSSSFDISGVVVPVNEEAAGGCWCEIFIPQWFTRVS